MIQWTIKQEIDLAKGDRAGSMRQSIEPLAYPGNANAHGWRVTVYNNGWPADLSGHTITAYFKRPDGNVVLVRGTVNNNVATVVLPAEVYALTGLVKAAMDASISGEGTTPLSGISFTIRENLTGDIIDPGEVIPATLEDLLAEIDAMRTATAAANTAAAAAEAASTAGDSKFVRFDAAQPLTIAQQAQARANAAAAGEIEHLLTADVIPDTVQAITFDAEGNVSAITHTRAGATVRTDAFTFTDRSITETRTLSTGQRLTLVTDLDTLAITATYAAA